MRAMILAAGRGRRMGPLTESLPKPLLTLQGETLIGRQLRRLAQVGVRDVVINLSYLGGLIRHQLGDGSQYGVRVRYSEEPEPPLETAGGIIQALPLLGAEPFLVVNADVVCDFDPRQMSLAGMSGVLVMVSNPPHHPRGDYGIGDDGRLTRTGPTSTFSGISLLSPQLFAGLTPGPRALSDVFEQAIAEGRLAGVLHRGAWFDVGTPERLALAEAALATDGSLAG